MISSNEFLAIEAVAVADLCDYVVTQWLAEDDVFVNVLKC